MGAFPVLASRRKWFVALLVAWCRLVLVSPSQPSPPGHSASVEFVGLGRSHEMEQGLASLNPEGLRRASHHPAALLVHWAHDPALGLPADAAGGAVLVCGRLRLRPTPIRPLADPRASMRHPSEVIPDVLYWLAPSSDSEDARPFTMFMSGQRSELLAKVASGCELVLENRSDEDESGSTLRIPSPLGGNPCLSSSHTPSTVSEKDLNGDGRTPSLSPSRPQRACEAALQQQRSLVRRLLGQSATDPPHRQGQVLPTHLARASGRHLFSSSSTSSSHTATDSATNEGSSDTDTEPAPAIMLEAHPLPPPSRLPVDLFNTDPAGVSRKCVRHGASGNVIGHVSVSPSQESTFSFLEITHHLRAAARSGNKAMAGTIYEVVIHPLLNAFAYLTPRVIYALAREAITDLLTGLLKKVLLDASTLPPIGAMDPAAVAAAAAMAGLMDLPDVEGATEAVANAAKGLEEVAKEASKPMDEFIEEQQDPPSPVPSEASKAAFMEEPRKLPKPVLKAASGLPDELTSAVVDSVNDGLVGALTASLTESIASQSPGYVSNKLKDIVPHHLAYGVGHLLSPKLMNRLGPSLTTRIQEEVTKMFLHSFSLSLTAAIGRSLTRSPVDDYVCNLCEKTKNEYCSLCEDSKTVDRVRDHLTVMYTAYFSKYYGRYYSTHFANVATTQWYHPFVDPKTYYEALKQEADNQQSTSPPA